MKNSSFRSYENPSARSGPEMRQIAKKLREIAALLEYDGPVDVGTASPVREAEAQSGTDDALPPSPERMIAFRRRREEIFGGSLFADPVWEMLLELFNASLSGGQVTIGELCDSSMVPESTALRHIARMFAANLMETRETAAEGRDRVVELSTDGLRKMCELLAKPDLRGQP